MLERHLTFPSLVIVIGIFAGLCNAQNAVLLKQERDGHAATHLAADELASLGDPFFNNVLKNHADETNLAMIEDLVQPDPGERQVFVVHENIIDSRPGQSRRSVIAFSGIAPNGQALATNVMISVFFDSDQFAENFGNVEVWGWDNHRGRYNYYKLDRTGTPDNRLTWKFRGSSANADLLSVNDRSQTCMACHINGAPLMKELLFPWNNWHSGQSRTEYLIAGTTGAWPVAQGDRLMGVNAQSGLVGAAKLESAILAAITQFNRRRINSALDRRDDNGDIAERDDQGRLVEAGGSQRVVEGRRLLRHLFFTTEYNIISDNRKTRLHPLPSPGDDRGPSGTVSIPNSFFLNSNLIAGGGITGYRGLGIKEAVQFSQHAQIEPMDYKRLIVDFGVQLHRRRPGDTNFAWFVPEPSHIDNDIVDQLMKRGIVSPQFVAAVLIIDLEKPLLSKKRASLLQFIPDNFDFVPLASDEDHLSTHSHPDELTKKVIAAIESSNPTEGSTEAEFLSILKSNQPLLILEERVAKYLEKIRKNLADPERKSAELDRLFRLAIEVRNAVNRDPVLGVLDESGGDRLFPVP